MRNWLTRTGFGVALSAGLFSLAGSTFAADPTDSTPVPSASGPKTPWSNYVSVNNITAEVRAVDSESVTLRVYWMAPTPGAKNTGRRPSLGSNRGHMNQMQMLMRMAKANQPKLHQEHHDYVVSYFPDTTARGVVGKTKITTPSDLVPGAVVEALLIRDKTVPLKDMKDTDFKVKALTAHGLNPNYKADGTVAAAKKK